MVKHTGGQASEVGERVEWLTSFLRQLTNTWTGKSDLTGTYAVFLHATGSHTDGQAGKERMKAEEESSRRAMLG